VIDERAKALGEALVKAGILKEEQLRSAISKASQGRAPTLIIGLLELEYLTFKVFEKFVFTNLGIKSAIVSGHDLNPTLLARIGATTINSKMVFPISTRQENDKKLLALGMVDPTDDATIHKIEGMTGWKIIPILISLPDFKEALQKNQKKFPGVHEINLKPEAGPFELQVTQYSEKEIASHLAHKSGHNKAAAQDMLGEANRKFREEILAKLDLEPTELSLLSASTYNREGVIPDIQRLSTQTLQKIFNQSSDKIKLEALINLMLSKGLISKNDILVFTAVSVAFSGTDRK